MLKDMTWGMTEGWWLFTDQERRSEYPLLQVRQWGELSHLITSSAQELPASFALSHPAHEALLCICGSHKRLLDLLLG